MGGAGEIWGISGPAFLLAYLIIAAAVWTASARARRALAADGTERPAGDLAAHPHDVAYLNGGADLAVWSALSAMHRSGTITTAGRGSVQAAGRPAREAPALERAVHFTAAGPMARHRLAHHRPVVTALQEIERRLVEIGLLLSEEQRGRIRGVGWWMVAVAGLGLVRLLAGVAAARPVGLLAVALTGAAIVGGVQLARAPRRSLSGDRALEDLRRAHHDLAPEMNPDWTGYGPAAAALGVGMFGMGALWTADPAFADELAAQKVTASASGGDILGSGHGSGSGGDSDGGPGCGSGGRGH